MSSMREQQVLDEDKHVVQFTYNGYSLQHPLACRPNLLDCIYEEYLREYKDEPDKEPGRYVMQIHENQDFDGYIMVSYVDVEDTVA